MYVFSKRDEMNRSLILMATLCLVSGIDKRRFENLSDFGFLLEAHSR